MSSYKGRVSELHAWLADRMALSQEGRQKERAEECPHSAESLKPRKGGGTGEMVNQQLISEIAPPLLRTCSALRNLW